MATKDLPIKVLNARDFSEMVEDNSHIQPQQTTPKQKCMPYEGSILMSKNGLKTTETFLFYLRQELIIFVYLFCHQLDFDLPLR